MPGYATSMQCVALIVLCACGSGVAVAHRAEDIVDDSAVHGRRPLGMNDVSIRLRRSTMPRSS
jgi:hypothetical protein